MRAIERDNDIQCKRQVMEILVAGIRVNTAGMGRAKQAHVTISYGFSPKHVVHSSECISGNLTFTLVAQNQYP